MDDFLKFQELRPKSTSSGEIVQQLMVMSLYVLMLPVLKSDSIYEDVFVSDDLVVKTSTSRKFHLEAKNKVQLDFLSPRFSSFSLAEKTGNVSSFRTLGVVGRDYLAMPGMPRNFNPVEVGR